MCLGKYEKLPEEYKKLIHKDTQIDTQSTTESKNLNLSLKSENMEASVAQLVERQPRKLVVAGSNPARGSRCVRTIFFIGAQTSVKTKLLYITRMPLLIFL